jgi:predicted transposase/invertase (TIGR01784 family)
MQTFSNEKNVSDFIRNFLSKDIANKINYDSIQIVDKEKLKINYKQYKLDLLVDVEIANTKSNIYFLFEHKSYKDKYTLIQVLSYCTAVWENNLKNGKPLQPIIPVIFYQSNKGYDLPLNFADYFDVPEDLRKYMVSFSYELFDTSFYRNEDIIKRSHDNLQLAAAIMTLKNIFSGKEGLEAIFGCLAKLENDYKVIILEYIFSTVDIALDELEEIARKGGIEDMPSLAERLETKGREEGIQIGEQIGEQRGKIERTQELLIKQMHLKYGITESEKDFIKSVTDLDKLDKATEAILFENNKEKLLDLLRPDRPCK